jgi:hypothetical protein
VSGVFGAVRRIYLQSGFLALYKGHSATLLRIFPYAAINFAAFEKLKIVLNVDSNSKPQPLRRLAAGSLAGALAVSFTYPFDIIRARIAYDLAQKLKSNQKRDKMFKMVASQLLSEGSFSNTKVPFTGFYQGFIPTILGIIPYAGVSFSVFEYSKNKLKSFNNPKELSSFQIFISGLLAGAIGQTVAYPFDVVRRRMQVFRITNHLPFHHYNSGLFNAISSIIHTHGWARGIFAGLTINYIKVAPASGISFLIYETLKNKFPTGLVY